MTEPTGLQWPLDAKGRRSSSAPGQRIVAAALHGLDAAAADAVTAERDWRHAYPRHWRALVQAQAARPVGVVASARDGLAAAWNELNFVRAGKPLALADAMHTPQRPLQTLQLRGQGDAAPAPWSVPHHGKTLRGDALARQIDRWEKAGICEPAHAAALRDCLAHPEWFDLSDQHLVLLGAGSGLARQMACEPRRRRPGPRRDLEAHRRHHCRRQCDADGAGRARPAAGRGACRRRPAGRHTRDRRLAGVAGPAAEHRQPGLPGRRAAPARVAGDGRDQLAYMATPTDVFAVPEDLAAAVMRRYAARGVVKKLAQFGARLGSGGRGFAPHIGSLVDAGDFGRWGLVDALVVEQGPNYALAKRLQQWRALVARADGHRVAFNVAPSTTTASVVSNPLLAAGFRGAKAFGVEVFEPETTNALMAAMWVHQLRTAPRDFAHPLKLLVHTANHGGLWRLPYLPRSVLPMAALLGFVKRR
jgi:hypothetical protein